LNLTRDALQLPTESTYPPQTVLTFGTFPDKIRRIDVLPGILDSGREVLLVQYERASSSPPDYALFPYEIGPDCALNALPVTPPIDLSISAPFWSLLSLADDRIGFLPAPNPILYSTRALYVWPGIGPGDDMLFLEFDRATGALDIFCGENIFFPTGIFDRSVGVNPADPNFVYGRFRNDYFGDDQRDFQTGGTLLRTFEKNLPTTPPAPPVTTGTTGVPPPVTTGTTGVPTPPPTTGTTATSTTTGGGSDTGDRQEIVVIFSVVGSVFGAVLSLIAIALATVLIVHLRRPINTRNE
jgi:hypothetical protein